MSDYTRQTADHEREQALRDEIRALRLLCRAALDHTDYRDRVNLRFRLERAAAYPWHGPRPLEIYREMTQ